MKAGGFLTGTPADIIDQLEAVEKRYPGLDRVVCSMALGTPLAVVLEQLTRFATGGRLAPPSNISADRPGAKR